MFNRLGIASGKHTVKVTRSSTCKHSRYPAGTQSQHIRFEGPDGREISTAHRYLLPDGSIGASGEPDPKTLTVGDIRYQLHVEKTAAEPQLAWDLGLPLLTFLAQKGYGLCRRLKCWVLGR